MANVFTASLCFVSLFALVGCASLPTSDAFQNSKHISKDGIPSTSPQIKILGTLPAGLTLETLPGLYVTEYVTAFVKEAWTEYIPVPSEYQWVDGEIKGAESAVIPHPPAFETVTETMIVQEETTELTTRSALYVKNGIAEDSVEVIEQVVPAITKELKRRVSRTTGPVLERVIPYEIKDGKTRVPIKNYPDIRKTHPAITEQVPGLKRQISPPTYIIKDETGQIIHRFKTRDEIIAFLE